MRLLRFSSRISIALLVTLGACASSGGANTPPAATVAPVHGGHHGPGGGRMNGSDADSVRASCPMALPDAHVRNEEVEGGVALTFTTEGSDVAELQRRVHALAQRHEGATGEKGPHGGAMPEATASVEETPTGARLVLQPRDPAQLDALRRHTAVHLTRMEAGECPMMECAHGR